MRYSYFMPSVFIDTERLRNLNSGLGQVCLRLGEELSRQRPETASPPWQLTFLVPRGRAGIFGPNPSYVDAWWLRKLWLPDHYDLWHCLHQDSVYLPRRAALILTIYDLNFLERSDYTDVRKAHRLAQLQRKVARATVLTTGSQYTASVIRAHLRVPDGVRIRVVATGTSIRESDAPLVAPPEAPSDNRPFFLHVGAIHPRKNLLTLVRLLPAFPDHRLVLAGPAHHPISRDVRDLARDLGVADRLTMPGPVDHATKAWLYAHCRALLFPSLSEGFGMPIVEAMVFGKPVFLSRLTSLPETGGPDAYYFDNFEVGHMAAVIREGLRQFEANPESRGAALRARAATFSWPNVADAFWEIYREVSP
jgi:glycosyltransferase involved in cell wall biosynthesis